MTSLPGQRDAASATRRPARVLIIDDDELTTVTFAKMLRLEGHEVTTAQNASEALEEARLLRPDAIIVDLHMPAMDGLTFVRRLRSQEGGSRTPVAMVTGDYSLDAMFMEQLKQLSVTLRYKPLWLEDLVKLATDLLATGAAGRERVSPAPPPNEPAADDKPPSSRRAHHQIGPALD